MHSVHGWSIVCTEVLLAVVLIAYGAVLLKMWPYVETGVGKVLAVAMYSIAPWGVWYAIYLKSPILTPKSIRVKVLRRSDGFEFDLGSTMWWVFFPFALSGISMCIAPRVDLSVFPGGRDGGMRSAQVVGIACIFAYILISSAKSRTYVRFQSTVTRSSCLGFKNIAETRHLRRVKIVEGGVVRVVDGDLIRRKAFRNGRWREFAAAKPNVYIPLAVLNSPEGVSVEELRRISGIEIVNP